VDQPTDPRPIHGPSRRPGDLRREAIRERVALRRELDAAVSIFDARYPDIFADDVVIPF
jgi:hypothetical protein